MNLYSVGSEIGDALKETLGGWGMWSAIIATISVIGLGFFLTLKNILNKDWDKVFIKVVMVVGLPSLALSGFLTNITVKDLIDQLAVLLIGFAFYALMMLISKYFFLKYDKDLQDTFAMCIALASTTFFGTPIVTAIYGDAKIPANIFNVPYRVFLYSLAFMIMSKKPMAATNNGNVVAKIKKSEMTVEDLAQSKKVKKQALKNIFVNPILIATFVGLIIWVTQLIPGIDVLAVVETKTKSGVIGVDANNNVYEGSISYVDTVYYSPLRIDKLFPPSATILNALAAICTPLAWLAIGMTMAKGNIKEAMKDKKLWYAASIKVLVAPAIILILICGVAGIGSLIVDEGTTIIGKTAMSVMVIMTAAPPANVVVAYAISYEKGAKEASNLTSLSTLLSVVTLPVWVVIVTAVGALPIFG